MKWGIDWPVRSLKHISVETFLCAINSHTIQIPSFRCVPWNRCRSTSATKCGRRIGFWATWTTSLTLPAACFSPPCRDWPTFPKPVITNSCGIWFSSPCSSFSSATSRSDGFEIIDGIPLEWKIQPVSHLSLLIIPLLEDPLFSRASHLNRRYLRGPSHSPNADRTQEFMSSWKWSNAYLWPCPTSLGMILWRGGWAVKTSVETIAWCAKSINKNDGI